MNEDSKQEKNIDTKPLKFPEDEIQNLDENPETIVSNASRADVLKVAQRLNDEKIQAQVERALKGISDEPSQENQQ